jgi:hypothetical protein
MLNRLTNLPLVARIVLFHMLAFANRKVNQRVALAVQVDQSRYVLLICKNSRHIQNSHDFRAVN